MWALQLFLPPSWLFWLLWVLYIWILGFIFVKFIPNYFILFDAVLRTVFLILLSYCSLLVYWNTTDFCILIILAIFKNIFLPQLLWLSWLRIIPCAERLLVQFLIRIHAWVAGFNPQLGACGGQSINVSLSPSPFVSL